MRTNGRWSPVHIDLAQDLRDARQQLHHAAQFAAAFGFSYLPHAADDSHTNLEWLPAHGVLASNTLSAATGSIRIGVRIADLTLLVIEDDSASAACALHGRTIAQAANWLREELGRAGLDGATYSLARHYEIPSHDVASGASFSADPAHLVELAHWFGNGAVLLEEVRAANDGGAVRCWPHHFDIATLITMHQDASVGVGLEPGDVYYDEPYFYVNAHPQPSADSLTDSLTGNGIWHTHEWIGAVLPASRIDADPAAQESQVHSFLESAVRSCRALALR
jgi:hypothetical protein